MSYPSSAVGCGCDSGESVASQGVTATAGCSGLEVPCIAVTNGVVTGLSSRTLEIPSSSAQSISFTFYDSAGFSETILSASDGLPAPETNYYSVFPCSFNPTNFRLMVFCGTADATGTPYGYNLQYSTDLSSWTTVSDSLLDFDGASSEALQKTGTLSVSGFSSAVYFRLIFNNTTGGNRAILVRSFTLSFWTS